MKRSKIFFASLPIILYVGFSIVFVANSIEMRRFRSEPEIIKNGVVEIDEHKEYNFLEGELLFAKNRFVYLFDELPKTSTIRVPSFIWNATSGYTTLGFQIKGLDPNKTYGGYISDFSSAFKIVINDRVVTEVGRIGTAYDFEIPAYVKSDFYFTPDENGVCTVVILASNFNYYKIPASMSMLVAEENVLEKMVLLNYGVQAGFVGVLVASAFFFALLFMFKNNYKHFLWLSLIDIAIAVFLAFSKPYLIYLVIPNLNWIWHFKLYSVLFIFILICIPVFIYKFFNIRHNIIYFILIALLVVYGVAVLVFDPLVIFPLFKYFILLVILNIIYSGVIPVIAMIRKYDGAGWIMLASIGFIVTSINDVFALYKNMEMAGFIRIGVLFYLMTITIMIIYKYAISFDYIERLTSNIYIKNQALSKFVPKEILKQLGKKDFSEINANDYVVKQMTVLVSDIRSFTSISEKLSVDETFKMLNRYLSIAAPIIRKYNGFILKFMGDGYTAIFEQPNDAADAAIEIQRTLREHPIVIQNIPKLKIGFGIVVGEILIGIMGSDIHLEACLSSIVAVQAGQLQDLTKTFDSNILVCHRLFNELQYKDKYSIRPLKLQAIDGADCFIYEIYDADLSEVKCLKDRTKLYLENTIDDYFRGDYTNAKINVEKHLSIFPSDKIAYHYKSLLELKRKELKRKTTFEN